MLHLMKAPSLFPIAILSALAFSCSSSDETELYVPVTPVDNSEELSGGINGTVFNNTAEAFGFAVKGLTDAEGTDFGVGNSFFRQTWISAPASTTARDGLGPFYNATACASCHFKDGRGRPPASPTDLGRGLLLRFSLAGQDVNGNPHLDPIYGGQLQDNALPGLTIKGNFDIAFEEVVETYADGSQVTLQKPIYNLINLGYGATAAGLLVSPRIANQMAGLGLLEAVDESVFIGFANEQAGNVDGVSGRVNYVYDYESNSARMGRFGWKANEPSIRQQVAAAFSGDIGITSSIFPNENCPPGVDCGSIPNGGSPEITDVGLARVTLYSSALSVPARRNYKDATIVQGKQLFESLQCISCHKPQMQTGNSHPIAALRNQTIRPYTDLLLHDMGPGLADNAPSFLASGSEWRTQPLWGIGIIPAVNGHTRLLHDGRARNVEEAILWHGGEAQAAKDRFKQLSATERTKLLAFINSL